MLENNFVSEHTLSRSRQLIHKRREVERFDRMRGMLNIRCNGEGDLITAFSGGNQQKVILARWLNTNADILLMDNPTQGIDVGAKAEIYKLILELARQGKTILVNTLEIPELQKVADRCIVFYHGSIHTELKHEDITEEKRNTPQPSSNPDPRQVPACRAGPGNVRWSGRRLPRPFHTGTSLAHSPVPSPAPAHTSSP